MARVTSGFGSASSIRFLLVAILTVVAFTVRGEDDPAADSLPPIVEEEVGVPTDDGVVKVFVIPIEGQIGKPTLYVVRLEPLEQPSRRVAQEQLCRKLTSLGALTPAGKSLVIKVGNCPLK